MVTREEHTVLGKIRIASGRKEAFQACAVVDKNNNRATVLVAVALSIFVGSGDLCWLCMVIRRPASPSPLHVALARGVCASGLCGSRTGPRGPPSPAAAEQWFSTFWGWPSGSPPPSLPLLSSLGHLGVQQQL